MFMLTRGDLLELAEKGLFDAIVHGCNCFHTMGNGIARQIKEKYPQAYKADLYNTKYGDPQKLGTATWSLAHDNKGIPFFIVNAYTQYYYNKNFVQGKKNEELFDYDAFDKVLKSFCKGQPVRKKGFRNNDMFSFGFPLIGCGLAGGDKEKVLEMLDEFSTKIHEHGGMVTVVEYDDK